MMRTEVHVDPDNAGQLIVARYADVDQMHAIANVCKALHNEGLHGSSDMRVMGHYPAAVVDNYCTRNGITLGEFIREPVHAKNIMRDPNLRYFRVWDGAV